VYSALKKLLDSGLVIEIPEKPKKYAPAPPKKALENLLMNYEMKTTSIFSIVASLDEIFEDTMLKSEYQKDIIWTIRESSLIYRKMEEILTSAKKIVEIATDERGSVLLFKNFNKLFDKLNERQVKIRLVTHFGDINKYVLDQLRYVLKTTNANIFCPIILLYVDRRDFLIVTLGLERNSTEYNPVTAIFSDNQVLAILFWWLILNNENTPLWLQPTI